MWKIDTKVSLYNEDYDSHSFISGSCMDYNDNNLDRWRADFFKREKKLAQSNSKGQLIILPDYLTIPHS